LDTPVSPVRRKVPEGSSPGRTQLARAAAALRRQGRCTNHPGMAAVGNCQVCGRSMCIACAVLVRGALVGSECLPEVLEDPPPPDSQPRPAPNRGDWLAFAGFGFVVVLSVFPWSRFNHSGFFAAWGWRWSLAAVVAAVVGFSTTLVARRRRTDPRLVAAILALLALIVGGAAFLAHRHPPPLAEASSATWIAIIGAALALIGALRKAIAGVRTRRPAFLTR
jgi:hypothetical protein